MNEVRLSAAVVAGVLEMIVALPNPQEVETRLRFTRVTGPRAVLLPLISLRGFITGLPRGRGGSRPGRPSGEAARA